MPVDFCVLGSGSSGNATVVRTAAGVLLIDAGLGPRTTGQRLAGTGVAVGQVAAICLTHLDSDHLAKSWFSTVLKQQIRLYCHVGKVEELMGRAEEAGAATVGGRERFLGVRELIVPFDGEPFAPLAGLTFSPIHLAHDGPGSHGFLIDSGVHRIGYATDLGHVPAELIELFCGVDLLALESNYDVEMEKSSDRPWFLKQRIMAGAGHLSNEQALAAIKTILDRTAERCGAARMPRHIVLLHRSRQCNCPKVLRRLFEQDARIKPVLTLAQPFERTEWLRLRSEKPFVGDQMALALG